MAGFRSFVVGCVLSAASIMTPVASAQAVPLAVPDVKAAHQSDVQTVNHRGYRHYRPRPHYRPYYSHRRYYRPGYRVYVAPPVVYRRGYGGSHVEWCLSRYRSYNPSTNRFLAYGGVYRVCRSPY